MKPSIKKFSLIFFTAVILLAGIFTIIHPAAAADLPSLVPACGASQGGCDVCDAIGVGINITKIMLGTLGSAALLMFVYGGVLMATSRGHTDQAQKGKDALSNAVKGVIIVLGSWVVINYGLAMLLDKSINNVTLFDNKTNWATVDCKSSAGSSSSDNIYCTYSGQTTAVKNGTPCGKNKIVLCNAYRTDMDNLTEGSGICTDKCAYLHYTADTSYRCSTVDICGPAGAVYADCGTSIWPDCIKDMCSEDIFVCCL